MAKSIPLTIREEYRRLKKSFEKILKPNKKEPIPQLVLQPYRNNKIF